MPDPVIYWRKNHPEGNLREPYYPGDAGYDLGAVEDVCIAPGKTADVNCGIHVAMPKGLSALIIGRSSMVLKKLITITTLIDNGYRGPLFVFLLNVGEADIMVTKGTRVAQLVLISNHPSEVVELPDFSALPKTAREGNGFGSSGDTHTTEPVRKEGK